MPESELLESNPANPRCFVVGMGSFAIACCEILLARGYRILGVCSPDGSLEPFARDHGIDYAAKPNPFGMLLLQSTYEWLFSLNNSWIIPTEVAEHARLGSVNYHDSPLPFYAGLHATAWALIAGETRHAITFHEVTATIDGGRILAQREVLITDADTSFSLNVRCFEAAICTFDSLVDKLANVGSPCQVPYQEASNSVKGSYFGRDARPPRAAILAFDGDARTLVNLVRALDFGPGRNPLSLPKLYLDDRVLAVCRAEVRKELPAHQPGCVVEIDPDGITVGTRTHPVRLSGFKTLEGVPLDVAQVAQTHGLKVATAMPTLSSQSAAELSHHQRIWARSETFWLQRLRCRTTLDLGLPVATGESEPRLNQLERLNAAAQITAGPERYPLLVTSLALLCARLSGQAILDLGMVATTVVGSLRLAFSQWVPLRIDLQGTATLGDALGVVAKALEEAERHGSFALDLVARSPTLRARPDVPYAVTFSTLGDAPPTLGSTPQLHFVIDVVGRSVTVAHPGALSEAQVDSLDRALCELTHAIQNLPETPWEQAALLDGQGKKTVLLDWNATVRPYPSLCTYAMVAASMEKFPNASAVRFGSTQLSYRELELRVAELAEELYCQGVRKGDVVAVSLHRSCEVVVAFLGVLRIGAAYLPIDPSYPSERGRAMLEDAGVNAAVCHAELKARFFADLRAVVELSTGGEASRRGSARSFDSLPAITTTPDDLFCVIYTSGSTGKPKGVEITHRGLVNHSCAIAENYSLGVGDRVLCSASIGFDVAGEQIYPALFSGAEVVVRPDSLFDSFHGFTEFVKENQLTVMILPTAFWHEWVRDLDANGADVPACLRVLSVGTEKVLGKSLKHWQSACQSRVRFCQGYGPTETTITSTMFVLSEAQASYDQPIPIGRPLPNTRLYVLDGNLHPVPVGAMGSLYIAGHGLARGYRNSPDLTQSRFLPCPFEPGERMYATGDLVRYQDDGQLIFVGRSDTQVKIRGFRVELGEIEHTLRRHDSVDEALVLLRTAEGEPVLCGYVVSRNQALTGFALQEFLRQTLPVHEVPVAIFVLPFFPKTTNQKVDKLALPLPTLARASEPLGPSSLRTPLQVQLSQMWNKVLGGVSVGPDDNFFDLGGNSLLAIRLLSEISKTHGVLVPLSQFFPNPTVSGLEAALQEASGESSLVVTIQRGHLPTPLWVVHPVGGHVVYATTLRRNLSSGLTIYGIQAQGVDGKKAPLDKIEDMAALYVELIQRVQPKGPYVIAGASMGGLIALEIAQRLQAKGEPLALLVMLDTWGPGYPRPTSRWTRHWDQLQNVRKQRDWASRLDLLRKRAISRIRTNKREVQGFAPSQYDLQLDESTSPEVQATLQRVAAANARADFGYTPAPFSGRTLLLRAAVPIKWSGMRFDDLENGWGPLMTGSFHVVSINCTHSELADNPPPEAARALGASMDDALGWHEARASLPHDSTNETARPPAAFRAH